MRFWGVQRFHFLQLYMNNCFLQPPEDGLLRGGCLYKMTLWNWPKRTLMSYYVLNSWRVAAIAVDLPHSYLLALHQNVLKAWAVKSIFTKVSVISSSKGRYVFEINVHVIIFPRNFCLLFNPLSPKNALENRVVLKIEYMNRGKWV